MLRRRGHHSVDPSERRTERTFGTAGQGRAKLERAGLNLQHFGEEIRFEIDSGLLAMAGIATRVESAESDRGSFAGLYTVVILLSFA